MLLSTKIVLAISILATSLATPLTQRAYIDELKGMMAHFATSWIAIENSIAALPKQNATVEQYKTATSTMVELVNYDQNNYNDIIMKNGPFTNVKWSNAFIEDMRVYPPHAVNAMQILQGHISQIAAVGGCTLVMDFETRTSDLRNAFSSMEDHLHRYIFQFVGADPVDSVVNEFHMVKGIGAVAYAFETKFWEIIYDSPGDECPYRGGN